MPTDAMELILCRFLYEQSAMMSLVALDMQGEPSIAEQKLSTSPCIYST